MSHHFILARTLKCKHLIKHKKIRTSFKSYFIRYLYTTTNFFFLFYIYFFQEKKILFHLHLLYIIYSTSWDDLIKVNDQSLNFDLYACTRASEHMRFNPESNSLRSRLINHETHVLFVFIWIPSPTEKHRILVQYRSTNNHCPSVSHKPILFRRYASISY